MGLGERTRCASATPSVVIRNRPRRASTAGPVMTPVEVQMFVGKRDFFKR